MKATGVIRRIDDIGRIVIPKEIRRTCKIKEGDPLEIYTERDGSIILKPYRESFEQYAIEWYNSHPLELSKCDFFTEEDYTFCITHFPHTPSRAGFAKRNMKDSWDSRIGKVAAYANAMGRNLNKMIGYEG